MDTQDPFIDPFQDFKLSFGDDSLFQLGGAGGGSDELLSTMGLSDSMQFSHVLCPPESSSEAESSFSHDLDVESTASSEEPPQKKKKKKEKKKKVKEEPVMVKKEKNAAKEKKRKLDSTRENTPERETSDHVTLHYNAEERGDNAFELSDEELRVIDVDAFAAYCKEVEAHHKLSSAELELKRAHRRRLLNRRSAQNSRLRKQKMAQSLSSQVERLTRRCAQLERALVAVGAPIPEPEEELVGEVPKKRRRQRRSATSAAAGVSLFAVLFAFGFLWGIPGISQQSQQPPMVPQAQQFPAASRSLMEVEPPAPVVHQSQQRQQQQQQQRLPPKSRIKPVARGRMKIIDGDPAPSGGALAPYKGKETTTIRHHSEVSNFEGWERPNTQYMYCPAVHQVNINRNMDPELPPRVSLLLPSDAFNNTAFDPRDSFPEGVPPLVEVSCSVMDVWPVWPNEKLVVR